MKDKNTSAENIARRKRNVKLTAALMIFVATVFPLSVAWYVNSREGSVDGIGMQAIDVEQIEFSMNAYYSDGNNGDDWYEAAGGIDFYPDDYVTVKFVLKNKTDVSADYYLSSQGLKVKYYAIQPFDESDWTADDEGYFYKTVEGERVLFGYDKELIQAGNYTYTEKVFNSNY